MSLAQDNATGTKIEYYVKAIVEGLIAAFATQFEL
jgi:hypothetical protein